MTIGIIVVASVVYLPLENGSTNTSVSSSTSSFFTQSEGCFSGALPKNSTSLATQTTAETQTVLFNVTSEFKAGNWVSILGVPLSVLSYNFFAYSPNSSSTYVQLEPQLFINVTNSQGNSAISQTASWTNLGSFEATQQNNWPPSLSPSQYQSLFNGNVMMRFFFTCGNQNVYFEIFVVTTSVTTTSTNSIAPTLSITAQINGSTIDTFGSALRITVIVQNNGTSTINIPRLYQIVQGVDVLSSTGTNVGGIFNAIGVAQTNSAGQIIPQTVSLDEGDSLIAYMTIVFLSSLNQTTPKLPVSIVGPTSINAYGTAYIQGNQPYTIRINAFQSNGQAATFYFPVFSTISSPCSTTFQNGLVPFSFLNLKLKQNASLQVCVVYYYYNDSSAYTINLSNWQQVIEISSQLRNGSINSSGNFTVTSSIASATLGGPNNEGEGSSVVYTITPKEYGNWTYGFSFGWLYPSMAACGQDFLLSTGNGSSYPFSGCTSSLSSHYPVNSEGFVNGFLFAEIVGVSNSTQ